MRTPSAISRQTAPGSARGEGQTDTEQAHSVRLADQKTAVSLGQERLHEGNFIWPNSQLWDALQAVVMVTERNEAKRQSEGWGPGLPGGDLYT